MPWVQLHRGLRIPCLDPSQLSNLFMTILFFGLFTIGTLNSKEKASEYREVLSGFRDGHCYLKNITELDGTSDKNRCSKDEEDIKYLYFSTMVTNLEAEKERRLYISPEKKSCYTSNELDTLKANETVSFLFQEDYLDNATKLFDCQYNRVSNFAYLFDGGFTKGEVHRERTQLSIYILATILFGSITIYFIVRFILDCIYYGINPPRSDIHRDQIINGPRNVYHPPNGNNKKRPLGLKDATLLMDEFRQSNTDHIDEDEICAICLEPIIDKNQAGGSSSSNSKQRKIIQFPCKHVYHEDCCFQWLRKGSPLCPCCFYDLSEELTNLKGHTSTKNDSSSNNRRNNRDTGTE